MVIVLIVSLIAACLSGMALFARGGNPNRHALEVAFGLSVAVFLGTLVMLLVRRAERTLEEDGMLSGDGPARKDDDDRSPG